MLKTSNSENLFHNLKGRDSVNTRPLISEQGLNSVLNNSNVAVVTIATNDGEVTEVKSVNKSLSAIKRPKKDPLLNRPNILDKAYNETFKSTKKYVQEAKRNIQESKYLYKIKKASQAFEFMRVFSTKGVQGVVGFLKCKKNNEVVVFKTSLDVNRSVEHEYEILESLNALRDFCPHFVRSYGLINIPISTDFIFESHITNLFKQDDESLPRNVLLMERINKLPFYRLCRNCTDKNIIISQMMQVLVA